MKQVQAFKKEKKEKKQTNKGYIIAIVLLSALLVISNVFGYVGLYSKLDFLKTEPSVLIGDKVSLDLAENASSSTSIMFKGSFVKNVSYLSKTTAKAPTSFSQSVLRAKYKIVGEGGTNFEILPMTDSSWVNGEDGYFYYSFKINAGESANLANGFVIPKFNSKQELIYSIIVQCECLNENQNISLIWQTAPKDWIESLS